MTYHLTAAGLDVCREIFKKRQKLLAEADEVRERTRDLGISGSELSKAEALTKAKRPKAEALEAQND